MPPLIATVMMVVFVVLIVLGLYRAERRKEQRIRNIPAMEGFREGIARSVEMGRPVLFHFGTLALSTDAAFLAPGISLLHRIAKISGELNAHLIATVMDPMLQSMVEDIIGEEYLVTGRAASDADVRFVAPSGFPYVAGLLGLLNREKPGAHFLMGTTNFEAIILCETASTIGAFQIAGSLGTWQLPMFIATCDYTLISEEFVVAGAMVYNDVGVLGTIAGQDWCKVIVIALVILGGLFIQFGNTMFSVLMGGIT